MSVREMYTFDKTCCVAQNRLAVASLPVVIAMVKGKAKDETPICNTNVMCVQKSKHKANVMCVAGHPTRVQDILEGAKV